MSKRTSVLIVDDNDMTRTLLRGILRGHDFEVVGEARNGAQAVEMAQRIKPAIICLDVIMPEKDGMAALREIREVQPEIRIVMVTGNASAENVREAIQNGAAGFIVKPFNAARVVDTLTRIAANLSG